MKKLIRVLSLIFTGAAVFAVPACAQSVQTDYDHSANFSQYHSYSWGRVHTTNPLFEDRIREDVDRNLQARGWQLDPKGGQIVVTVVGARENKQEYETFYEGFGPGWRWRGWGGMGETETTVENVPVGSLVLDMYDGSSHQLVWRGTAQDTLSKDSEKNVEKVKKAVDKLLDKFPPK
ncbi:MAG: DUF4136 domain-containing protein [Terracidiphilus sp.]|jgi:hypothetical protein